MLKQIEINNFKSITKTTLKLAPLTILTGCNSSGKTTIIQALMLLIKYSLANNNDTMKTNLSFLDDFSTIRNKKTNAKEIYINAIDDKNQSHQINITDDDIISETNLKYKFEDLKNKDLNELFYLNSNRIGIQEIATISDLKVGIMGEYLLSSYDKIKDTVLSDDLLRFKESNLFHYQLNKWLTFIIGYNIELITKQIDSNIQISFHVKDFTSNISPYNVGGGVSNLSKILIICLMAKKGDLILLENPEKQLHPQSQAQLGVFLCYMASKGIQIIVETHCEHFINKVRHEVYANNINYNDIVIHYKSSSNTQFNTLFLNTNGKYIAENKEKINFPNGFFDSTLDNLIEIEENIV